LVNIIEGSGCSQQNSFVQDGFFDSHCITEEEADTSVENHHFSMVYAVCQTSAIVGDVQDGFV